ncbi:MAG: two-component sensor histidine kinase, partial [Betaproteobacteria bacterium]
RVVDGEPSHVFVLQSGSTWIQVAEKDEVRAELLHDLGVAVMTPLVVGAALLLILVNILVIYGLAPLRQLAASIARREPASLGAVEVRHVPEELAPVVQALNDLLLRVSLAFEHERRFTDAAAHELRTPLAALKIHADNVARAQTEAERAESMSKLREGLDRASKLAAQMLAYSRAQNSVGREDRVEMRLADVLRAAIATTEALRQAKHQRIAVSISRRAEETGILGEPTNIERLAVNLLDNAARYAPERSTIEVLLTADHDGIALSVANEGPAIAPELRERVFEPYYRIPGSGSEGSGLGLAIVKEIASRHGASVGLDAVRGEEGTIVSVRFPIHTGV